MITLPKEQFTPSVHPVLGPSEGELSTDPDPVPTTTKGMSAQLYDPYSSLLPPSKSDVSKNEKKEEDKKDKKDTVVSEQKENSIIANKS